MHKSAKEKRIVDIMSQIPRIDPLSDEAIAELIKNEYSMTKSSLNSFPELELRTGSKAPPINKTFLKNTIHATESHNRREEIADCWREHDMLERSREYSSRERHVAKRSITNVEQEADRAYWASRKARIAKVELSVDSDDVNGNDAASQSDSSTSTKESKRKKKSSKSKKKKKKKEKKKKNQH